MVQPVLNNGVATIFQILGQIGPLLVVAALLAGQAGPPVPPPPPPLKLTDRLQDIRRRLESVKGVNMTAERALQYSRSYLGKADQAFNAKRTFAADRFAEAADSLLHIAEHQEHLRASGGGPARPPPPAAILDHLQHVYFRTQQADYFLKQAQDREADSFPKWARDFYQLARRAYDRRDWVAADENAKCADEVVKALENLAQAASPATIPAPPPGPPPPPPPKPLS